MNRNRLLDYIKCHTTAVLATVVLGSLGGCAMMDTHELGVSDGRLADCPWAPRCVSSQSSDPDSRVPPIRYSDSLPRARQRMLAVLHDMDNARIVKVEERYIHARFSSGWLGFTDDLEILFIPEAEIIHIRSSARLGYYDFDVNRERINTIRSRFLTGQ